MACPFQVCFLMLFYDATRGTQLVDSNTFRQTLNHNAYQTFDNRYITIQWGLRISESQTRACGRHRQIESGIVQVPWFSCGLLL